MREIKFRAWLPKRQEMIIPYCFIQGYGWYETHKNREELDVTLAESESGKYIIMQFTGLKDKNGKEIYDGDIVEWTIFPDDENPKRIRDTVAFGSGCFKAEKRLEILGTKEPHRKLEVIGNIYENPELLNQ